MSALVVQGDNRPCRRAALALAVFDQLGEGEKVTAADREHDFLVAARHPDQEVFVPVRLCQRHPRNSDALGHSNPQSDSPEGNSSHAGRWVKAKRQEICRNISVNQPFTIEVPAVRAASHGKAAPAAHFPRDPNAGGGNGGMLV